MKRFLRVFELTVPEQRIVIALTTLLMIVLYVAHRVEKSREKVTPLDESAVESSPTPATPP